MVNKQAGFVSILTVLFFTTLISVATLSFARAMVLERQQQLEDELTKSAYNAALTGIEDAKRAMAYCFTRSGSDRTACEAALDLQTCPGFNTGTTFTTLGIQQSSSGRTSVTSESAAAAAQGYSCVIVTRNTESIEGTLSHTSGASEVYEARTLNSAQAYQKIRIYWGGRYDTVTAPADNNNPQEAGWGERTAVLRIGFVDAGDDLPLDSPLYTWFAIPVASGGVNQLTTSSISRANVNCNATAVSEGYRCYVDIMVAPTSWRHKYVVLSSLYKETNYKIIACEDVNCSNRRIFDGVQPTIDSTGYTSGVSRRVKANVTVGGQSIANAIDTSYGFCKNFRVGVNTGDFADHAITTCR